MQEDQFDEFESLDDFDESEENGKVSSHCLTDDEECEWDDDYDLEGESRLDSLFDTREDFDNEE